ncbi:MAG TPA: exopolysaccharide transport family protein [Rhizomicrobium sp.]|nr:exopolysaccharide transport family protein [Rhizomicrobium sp.]
MSPYQPLAAYAPAAGAYPAAGPVPAFQLADLIRLVYARRVLILRVAAGVVLLALVVALLLPTTWSGSAEVMLDQRHNNVTDLSAVLSQLPDDPATLQNQIQILTSRELAGKVVDRLRLTGDPEFNPVLVQPGLGHTLSLLNPRNWFGDDKALSAGRQRDRTIDEFLKHVSVGAQGLSTAVTVTVTSKDPAKAALLANTLADVYVRSQVATKVSAATATTGWLSQRLHDLARQLQQQEEAVQRYKAQHGLTDSGPGNSLVDQQLIGINTQVVQARSELAEKQAIEDRITQLMAGGNPADIAQIVSSPLIVQLRAQQAQLLRDEGLAYSKYGPLHPKMQAIETQKRDLDQKIAQEVSRLAASAASDVMVARAHLASLESSLRSTERTANGQNLARVQLQALESNAASTRTMYEAFVQRLRQSQNADEIQTPESRIISAAPVPSKPSGPKRTLIVGASLPLGLLLGLLCALLLEKLGPLMPVKVDGAPRAAIVPPKKAPPPAPAWNGPPILGEIDDNARLAAADFMLDYPASRFSFALGRLVQQLKSQGGDAAVIALTAADAGESRAAIAAGLARAAAKMGKKTVVIDCAPEGLVTRALKAPVRNGVYEVLTGKVKLNQALARDPRGNAHVLGTPRRPPNAPTMFSSPQMKRLVSTLRGGADFIVIDCGVAAAGTEAALLARLADATVLVARRRALHGPLVANAARILESARAAPIGIVVTR